MEITFLGTGTSGGVPLIGCQCRVCKSTDPRDKRLRTSVLIKHENQTISIDCGPDFRQQMLRENVMGLDAILVTHLHRDHTGGIDDIRAFNFIQKKALDLYCDDITEEAIKEQFSYIFEKSDYPYLPQLNFIKIDDAPFHIGNLNFIPIEVMHGPMPVKAFRFGDITYITDAKTIAPEEIDKIRGSKILIVNALRHTDHYSHFTVDEAIALSNEIKPDATYFVHMSHQFGLHAEEEKKLPSGIHAAYDGLKIQA